MQRTFFIGDVQGCFDGLLQLVKLIDFSPSKDLLLFCGDIVNRGPKSLETLNYIYKLNQQGAADTVLGNHDIHLLAVAQGLSKPKRKDTLTDILQSKHHNTLLDWLTTRPLSLGSHDFSGLTHPSGYEFFLTHAGLYPLWHTKQASLLAQEAQAVLSDNNNRVPLLKNLYGDTPNIWSEGLSGLDRLRFIINATTRMRYVDAHGHLKLNIKGVPGARTQAQGCLPWFELLPTTETENTQLFFGHWSALEGLCPTPNIEALDTGFVWGGSLTAYHFETGERHSVCAN